MSNGTLRSGSRQLVLASASPRRRDLLQMVGMTFIVHPSDADESLTPGHTPGEAVEVLSYRKATQVLHALTEQERALAVILGADTVVVDHSGVILGKPADETDAFSMIARLQGTVHTVYSGIALLDAASGTYETAHCATRVYMKSLTEEQIAAYVGVGESMDKAGAYAIQGHGSLLIDKIEGCYYNVVGLPLSLLHDRLARFGIQVLNG